jgi:hypothetical protein
MAATAYPVRRLRVENDSKTVRVAAPASMESTDLRHRHLAELCRLWLLAHGGHEVLIDLTREGIEPLRSSRPSTRKARGNLTYEVSDA